ncbi:hypothetical protein LMG26846_01953 [Achromobacter insuavis]|uniref:hypothetical protein n=1 Tax=Achromobacter insuavis TaxID=1287735 RepID=UPI0014675382|nr:hypothetical protein [Achromobacter insuavis]CAB3850209.1 hypothetical protein LMG26846_01953 [Achromobacter insuavis]
MILISTLRKMGDKPVFIVDIPAHTVQVGDMPPVNVPAHRGAFATKPQADKYAATHDPRQFGASVFPVVSRMTARAYADQQGWTFTATA